MRRHIESRTVELDDLESDTVKALGDLNHPGLSGVDLLHRHFVLSHAETGNLIAEDRYRMILDGLQVTLLITFFAAVLGTDLLTGSACGRVTNLASNLTSMLMYIHAGQVDFLLTVPAAVCYGLGGYAGSGYALKGGSKNVRKVMFVVLALLFIKVGMDLAGVSF